MRKLLAFFLALLTALSFALPALAMGEDKPEFVLLSVTITYTLPGEVIEFGYEFVPGSGNIQAISVNGVEQHRYDYDGIGQLIRDAGPGRVSEYAYDMGGNLRSVVLNGETVKTFFYDNAAWTDQLTAVEIDGVRHALSYDALGNLTSFNGRNFAWQKGRQLASITESGREIHFTYDHTGLRTSKTVNGVTSYYVWAGSLLMARYTPQRGETLAWHYDQSGTMLGFTLNGVPYFYIRNLQGDVTAVIDQHGNVVARYSFDAWGNVLSAEGPLSRINPITYRGYYFDWETGLYYLQSRYYCPQLRRFVSADVFMDTGVGILGTNMYAYCNNDPVNLWDPDGRAPIFIVTETAVDNTLRWSTWGRVNILTASESARVQTAAILGAKQYAASRGFHSAHDFRVTSQRFDFNHRVLYGEITFQTNVGKQSMEFTLGRRQNLIDYTRMRATQGRLAHNQTYNLLVSGIRAGVEQQNRILMENNQEPTGSAEALLALFTFPGTFSAGQIARSPAGRLHDQLARVNVSANTFLFTPTRI